MAMTLIMQTEQVAEMLPVKAIVNPSSVHKHFSTLLHQLLIFVNNSGRAV